MCCCQGLFEFRSGFVESVVFFGAAFDGAGFESAWPIRVDFDVAKGRVGERVGQSPKCVGKAESVDGDVLSLGSGVHDGANEVVDQGKHGQFFEDAFLGFAMQHVHLHSLFQMSQIGFDLPTLAIQFGQGIGRIEHGIEQGGGQSDVAGTATAARDLEPQFADGQGSGEGVPGFFIEPFGGLFRFDVFNKLVFEAEFLEPTR